MTGEPNKTSGQFHSVKGSVVETVGNMTGAESWQNSGKQEHAEGEAEYKASQAKGYAEGTVNRLAGHGKALYGALIDDTEKQTSGNVQKEKGKVEQTVNDPSA